MAHGDEQRVGSAGGAGIDHRHALLADLETAELAELCGDRSAPIVKFCKGGKLRG
jgi:hypothetical protein